jgi:hypothetical protein
MSRNGRSWRGLYGAGALLALLLGCGRTPSPPVVSSPIQPTEFAGLHNVHQVAAKLWSGFSPEGETGFASLKALGIQTILSVDGARPEVELVFSGITCWSVPPAHRSSMRWILNV